MLYSAVICITLALANSASAYVKLSNDPDLKAELQVCIKKSGFTKDQFGDLCNKIEPETEPEHQQFLDAIECLWTVPKIVGNEKVDVERTEIITSEGQDEVGKAIVRNCPIAGLETEEDIAHALYVCFRDSKGYQQNCRELQSAAYPDID